MLTLRRLLLFSTLATAAVVAAGPAALAQQGKAAAAEAALRAGKPRRPKTERGLQMAAHRLSRQIGEVARGIETSLERDDVGVASKLYRIEMDSVALIHQAEAMKFKDPVVKERTMGNLIALHGDILRLQERVLDHALDELDRALPGEPTRELWAREGIDLYRPLFRKGTPDPNAPPPTREDNVRVFREMQEAFAAEGGTRSQINQLGPRSLERAVSGELIEWVQVGNRIRMTAAGAKHPVIADGSSVRGAGSMKLYKNAAGEVILAVVSNSSGNYKPGIGSVFGIIAQLESLGVRRDRIVETRILPGEPVLVKLLLKSKKKLSKEQINQRVARLKSSAEHDLRRLISSVTTAARKRATAKKDVAPRLAARELRAKKSSSLAHARRARAPRATRSTAARRAAARRAAAARTRARR